MELSLVRLDPEIRATSAWARGLVQTRTADPVLAAAEFRPNARGAFWFSSLRGFGERQVLESRGVYLGGRFVVGVTAREAIVLELVFGGHLLRELARLGRDRIVARPVGARTDKPSEEAWPAALLFDERGREMLEIRVVSEDARSWDLLAALFDDRRRAVD